MKYFLTGFMGAGKSYVGSRLSKLLDLPFYDLDDEIESQVDLSIPEIFSTQGEASFRHLEKSVLTKIAVKESTFICSTGGGAPCFFDNSNLMRQHGTVVYLRTNPSIIVNRVLKEIEKRPLLMHKTKDEVEQFVQEKITSRAVFYEQADIIYDHISEEQDVVNDLYFALKRF